MMSTVCVASTSTRAKSSSQNRVFRLLNVSFHDVIAPRRLRFGHPFVVDRTKIVFSQHPEFKLLSGDGRIERHRNGHQPAAIFKVISFSFLL